VIVVQMAMEKSPPSKKEIQQKIDTLVADSVESLWNYNTAGFVQELLFFRRGIRLMKEEKFLEEFDEIKIDLRELKRKLETLKNDCKLKREKEKNEIIVGNDIEIKKNRFRL